MRERLRSKRGGFSLLDVIVGATLLSITATSLGVGVGVIQNQIRLSRERAEGLSFVQEDIATRQALAQLGTLQPGTYSRNVTVRGNTTAITTVVTGPIAPTADVYEIVSTATWSDGPTRNATMRTRTQNKDIGEVVSVHFLNTGTPNMSSIPSEYMGYGVGHYLQRRWTRLATAGGTEPTADAKGVASTIRLTVVQGEITQNPSLAQLAANVTTRAIYQGMIRDTAGLGSITLDVTGIPYASYELVVYYGMDLAQGYQTGWLEIDGDRRIPIATLDYTASPGFEDVLMANRNFVVLGPLSGGSHRIRILPTSTGGYVLPISAVQVARK